MEKETLRGYKNFQVLKNVSNPVMFLGLPMKLAWIFIGVIITSAFTAMIMKSMEVSLPYTIGIPCIIAFVGISIVRKFYKTFGVKGFSMTQRDKTQPNQIQADKTIQQILKEK